MEHSAPQGVRIILKDGRTIPCQLIPSPDTTPEEGVWEAHPREGFPMGVFDYMQVDELPPGCSIRLVVKLEL